MDIDLTVLVATAGRPDLLRRTLLSLAACDKPSGYQGTMVVENGPPAGAERVVQEFATSLRATYMHVALPNKSQALNEALKRLGDCLIYFTDDDVRFSPNVLCAYDSASNRFGRGHFFGGPTSVDYVTPPSAWLIEYLSLSARGWSWDEKYFRKETFYGFLGFNWAAFKNDIVAVNGFNPLKGPGLSRTTLGDETEAQRKLMEIGIKPIFVPEAMVWHYVPTDRCSPSWVINRIYQAGICTTLSIGQYSGPYIFGYPRWMLRKWLACLVQNVCGLFSTDAKTRFLAQYNVAAISGKLQGMRLRSDKGLS